MYKIFDLETTIHQSHKRKANCFDPNNYVVAEGWKNQGDKCASWNYLNEEASKSSSLVIEDDVTLLVGHNIKFDLLWELRRTNRSLEAFLKRGGRIWCTQYAEYLIRAQHPDAQMCALNDLAPKYGGTTKIDEVKLMWEAGINTPDIPEDLLIDYLVGTPEEGRDGGDIGNTEKVFLGQIKIAMKQQQILMIQDRMDGLLSTTFMEFFGLKVDIKKAAELLRGLEADQKAAQELLESHLPEMPELFTFNWGSPTHKSVLLFGGTLKYREQVRYKDEDGSWARKQEIEKWPLFGKVPVDPRECSGDPVFGTLGMSYNGQDEFVSGKKIGMPKFRNVKVQGEYKIRFEDFRFTLPGFVKGDPRWEGSLMDAGGVLIYSTSGEVIEALEKYADTVPFLDALTKNAALNKEVGTYFVRTDDKGVRKGMLTCVQPSDHILHHKLNSVNTVTTRLSSSDPNLQNLPRGDKSRVKEMFISRWAVDGGLMLELDYSQLEVVVSGVLTGDVQLIEDLIAKVDFHCKRVAASKGCTYEEALDWCKNEDSPKYKEWKTIRTKAKIFSFQRAYGAGASTIAEATGMSETDVMELIEAEEKMYPGVTEFHDSVTKAVNDSAEPFKVQFDHGGYKMYRRGYWQSPTGTIYSWRSWDSPEFMAKRGIADTFSPPEIKNYPTQGTGGEFVQAMLGRLIRKFIEEDFYGNGMFDPGALLCNTVHDCIWIDSQEAVHKRVYADVKPIMESIPEYYSERYGIDIPVPFPVDGEVGLNMNDLHHMEM